MTVSIVNPYTEQVRRGVYQVTPGPRFVQLDGKRWTAIAEAAKVVHDPEHESWRVQVGDSWVQIEPATPSMRTAMKGRTTQRINDGYRFGPVLDLRGSGRMDSIEWKISNSGGKEAKDGWLLATLSGVELGMFWHDWVHRLGQEKVSIAGDRIALDVSGQDDLLNLDPTTTVDYSIVSFYSAESPTSETAWCVCPPLAYDRVGFRGASDEWNRVAARFGTDAIAGTLVSSTLRWHQRVGWSWDPSPIIALRASFASGVDAPGNFYYLYNQWLDSNNWSPHSTGLTDNWAQMDATAFTRLDAATDLGIVAYQEPLSMGSYINIDLANAGFNPYLQIVTAEAGNRFGMEAGWLRTPGMRTGRWW